jgi:hypothetical protein
MTFPPSHPLHEEFKPPEDDQLVKQFLRLARVYRLIPAMGVLALLTTITVPLPLSPSSARLVGIVGLGLVAIGLLLLLAISSSRPRKGLLLDILARSERIEELDAAGSPISSDDRTLAIEVTRRQIVEASAAGWVGVSQA